MDTLSKKFFKTTLLKIVLLLLQYNLEINVKLKRSRGKIGLDPIGQASIDSSQGDVECLVYPVRDRTSAIPRKCHFDHYFTGNCNTKYTSSAVFRSSLDLYSYMACKKLFFQFQYKFSNNTRRNLDLILVSALRSKCTIQIPEKL